MWTSDVKKSNQLASKVIMKGITLKIVLVFKGVPLSIPCDEKGRPGWLSVALLVGARRSVWGRPLNIVLLRGVIPPTPRCVDRSSLSRMWVDRLD